MFKKLFPVLLLCLLFASTVSGKETFAAMDSSPLDHVQSYKIFYDEPTQKIQRQMKKYDLVIVEPAFYTKELVTKLQKSGTKLYAYVSVMESDTWNTERIESLQPQDFFIKNGERVHFEEWDSYLMDMTSSHYRSVLMNDIQTQVVDKGFDGVFFDTVGDMEDQFYGKDPQQYNAQKSGFITLLNQLDRQYENLSNIQNWGIELFRADTVQYMDALMWEGFEYKSMTRDEWSQNQIKGLQQLQKKHNFKVLTVSFEQHAKSKKYAEKQGFLHYAEHKNFNQW
ncbi:endo alpha-1,4 polygalactosaminidase [Sporosarcina jeotgali]|uniref:Endo alpha-1,4 polygalactosaminidase n=1 Tax=Sporosarcina jeotgali TaxID=3020056 RepID=A0ABZ0KW21_9BACL|nr:endo alpha-1,4 polygalactosaminidase [Sporosarcina sp. B2O-1]WOV84450.1 endo alpha-1,4 polygalactosaminidase [Sporosarcina sp. B2O-1]